MGRRRSERRSRRNVRGDEDDGDDCDVGDVPQISDGRESHLAVGSGGIGGGGSGAIEDRIRAFEECVGPHNTSAGTPLPRRSRSSTDKRRSGGGGGGRSSRRRSSSGAESGGGGGGRTERSGSSSRSPTPPRGAWEGRRKPRSPTTEIVRTRGMDCVCHVWTPDPFPASAASSSSSPKSSKSPTREKSRKGTSNSKRRRREKYNHANQTRSSSAGGTGVSSKFDPTPSPPPPRPVKPRGVALVFHGLGGHALFPTVRYLAELLVTNGYVVYGPDFPGHGSSPGLRGYISSADDLVKDGVNFALYAKKRHGDLPLFLAGSSMGGAIALGVSKEFDDGGDDGRVGSSPPGAGHLFGGTGGPNAVVSGLVLLAPMVSVTVPRWQRRLLGGLAALMPKKALFPPAEDATEMQFRDEQRRTEIQNDALSYKGSLRVASAYSCLQLTRRVNKSLDEINVPFLCVIGSEDVVVDNAGAEEMMARATRVRDKTLKEYEALHGLLCEVQPIRGYIEHCVVDWLGDRTEAPEVWDDGGGGETAAGEVDERSRSLRKEKSKKKKSSKKSRGERGGGASASASKKKHRSRRKEEKADRYNEEAGSGSFAESAEAKPHKLSSKERKKHNDDLAGLERAMFQ